MRLLQLGEDDSLSLVEYNNQDLPPYTILSHTWSPSSEEVSFADFKSGHCKSKPGYEKIRLCGGQTSKDELKHFWVDTCCINKDSSAELSEAINSMYMWYQHVDVCYVYLSDVRDKNTFHNSRWFRRGWTLQELLAPADVIFFDASWSTIGIKTCLTRTLSRCTGIDEGALLDGTELDRFSVAEWMSWAAHRQTSRIEDEAYCLLGLFDVNIPLIYGEGSHAFVRSQEELLRRFDDASIFAYSASIAPPSLTWALTESDRVQYDERPKLQAPGVHEGAHLIEEAPTSGTTSLLATSPTYFQAAAEYRSYPVLNRVLEKQGMEGQSASRIRRSGHLIKLQALFWEGSIVQSRFSYHCKSAMDIQTEIQTMYGLKLTLSSVRKLRFYSRTYDKRLTTVAFLDCSRQSGGVVGIALHQNMDRGT